jgi:hypothetical protein
MKSVYCYSDDDDVNVKELNTSVNVPRHAQMTQDIFRAKKIKNHQARKKVLKKKRESVSPLKSPVLKQG